MTDKENKVQMLILMASIMQKEAKKIEGLCNTEVVNISEIERGLRHPGDYHKAITQYVQEIKLL